MKKLLSSVLIRSALFSSIAFVPAPVLAQDLAALEIAKFAAEKENASADIGDVGAAFGPIAVQKGVTQPYKPTTW